MKRLTYLLLWLSVLTFGHAARAADAAFLPATPAVEMLPLPGNGIDVPVGRHKRQSSELPPPPPALAPAPVPAVETPSVEPPPIEAQPATPAASSIAIGQFTPEETAEQPIPDRPSLQTSPAVARDGTLSFTLPAASAASTSPVPPAPPLPRSPAPPATLTSASALDVLFIGNENSVVAKAVGAAEGTRTPDGGRNPAYYGHTDPGNGVWNVGSFSYQHGATSPEEADAKQLARLRRQADQILQKASDKGLALSVTEKLNGIDLANQAPAAALGQQGYVDWLAVAKAEGKPEADAVLSARVRSFIDPRTQRWNAPGLGNTEDRITRDQARRMRAIDRAILANQQQIAQIPQTNPSEDQLMSQQSESAFTGVNPASEDQQTAAGTIAEAPNTDTLIHFDRSQL